MNRYRKEVATVAGDDQTCARWTHVYYDYQRRTWAAEVRTPTISVDYTGFPNRLAAQEWTLAVLRADRYETRLAS